MGRPKKGEEKRRSASVRFRVREEISAGLRGYAQAHSLSLADAAEEALAIGLAQMERKAVRPNRKQA